MFATTLDKKTRTNLSALIALIVVAAVASIPVVSAMLHGSGISPAVSAFIAR